MSRYPPEADEAQYGHYNDGYYETHYDPFQPPPPPPPPPLDQYGNPYTPHDRFNYDDEHDDTGDIPLLRRDPSTSSTIPISIPGAYDEDTSNIRYGRIPQRIPRRYKTIKRVESVSPPSTPRLSDLYTTDSSMETLS
jgi:chitin synthase